MALSLPVLAVFRKTWTCKAYTGHEVFSFLSQANLQLFFLACGKYHRDISHVERESRRFLYIGEPCLPSFLPRCHIAKFATLLNILKVVAKGVQGLSNLFIRFIIQFNFYSSTCEICLIWLHTLKFVVKSYLHWSRSWSTSTFS